MPRVVSCRMDDADSGNYPIHVSGSTNTPTGPSERGRKAHTSANSVAFGS
jgi:hypothetical protein